MMCSRGPAMQNLCRVRFASVGTTGFSNEPTMARSDGNTHTGHNSKELLSTYVVYVEFCRLNDFVHVRQLRQDGEEVG